MRNAVVVLVLILAGCSAAPTGKTDIVENELKEISFMGAHQDERCSKGCRYEFVPDTWYLNFCNVSNPTDCTTKKITHAPWKWQHEGQRVKFAYQQWEGSGSSWWKITSITISATGEQVQL